MVKNTNDQMGDRLKAYEAASSITLIKGTPKIIRLDGKSFHTWVKTAGCEKPFDEDLIRCMATGAAAVMSEIGGSARFAYIQSDECSIVLNDSLNIYSDPWYGNKLQKIVSVSASIMSVAFTNEYWEIKGRVTDSPKLAFFDSRFFQVPNIGEMVNAILWRQFDASKNSISQYARSMFSHKELNCKNGSEMQDMMHSKGFNWNDAPTWSKRGIILKRNVKYINDGSVKRKVMEPDWEIPVFSMDPDYLVKLYMPDGE